MRDLTENDAVSQKLYCNKNVRKINNVFWDLAKVNNVKSYKEQTQSYREIGAEHTLYEGFF